ncbi:MAG: hypothetical protein ACI33N_03520 [Desulfovibrionaceae bacterium]
MGAVTCMILSAFIACYKKVQDAPPLYSKKIRSLYPLRMIFASKKSAGTAAAHMQKKADRHAIRPASFRRSEIT